MCNFYHVKYENHILGRDLEKVSSYDETLQKYYTTPTYYRSKTSLPSKYPVIRNVDGKWQIEERHWGVVPFWHKKIFTKRGSGITNSRIEKASGIWKPFISSKRCLVPACGYFEYMKIDEKTKQPYYITLKNRTPFVFAGIYDSFQNDDGQSFNTFSIITTAPESGSFLEKVHNRVPTIMMEENAAYWLDEEAEFESLVKSIQPYPSSDMEAWPVDRKRIRQENVESVLEPIGPIVS